MIDEIACCVEEAFEFVFVVVIVDDGVVVCLSLISLDFVLCFILPRSAKG